MAGAWVGVVVWGVAAEYGAYRTGGGWIKGGSWIRAGGSRVWVGGVAAAEDGGWIGGRVDQGLGLDQAVAGSGGVGSVRWDMMR